ncbi:MAG TPA: PepSY domain-containing protein [Thermopetrobacter sp.]|nr:PepSY domain-containing protein [Thermopetrobacter sp.]
MTMLTVSTTALMLAAAAPALATECTSAPADKWMSQEQARKILTGQGYDVRKMKVEDSCLEAYAMKDGRRLEVYLDPVSGKIVKIKEK